MVFLCHCRVSYQYYLLISHLLTSSSKKRHIILIFGSLSVLISHSCGPTTVLNSNFNLQNVFFWGYSSIHRGYFCLHPSGRFYIFSIVHFNESDFPFPSLMACSPLFHLTLLLLPLSHPSLLLLPHLFRLLPHFFHLLTPHCIPGILKLQFLNHFFLLPLPLPFTLRTSRLPFLPLLPYL